MLPISYYNPIILSIYMSLVIVNKRDSVNLVCVFSFQPLRRQSSASISAAIVDAFVVI